MICLIISTLNFLEDLNDSSFHDAIIEQFYLLPLYIIFIAVVFFIRKKTIESHFYKKNSSWNKKVVLFSISIGTIIFFSTLFRIFSLLFFDDDNDKYFFDNLFFAIFTIASGVVLFIYLLEIFIENEMEKKELKILLKQNEIESLNVKYQSLRNQLNPHFLFNSFNSIISLIELEPKKAILFIEELSNVFRYNLEKSDETLVTLSEEINLLNSYFDLQVIRFGNAIKLDIDIDVTKLNFLIPPLTIEILVENALKHTVFDLHKPLIINIYTNLNELLV
jgi:sensor histidine kinase YesM